MNEFLSATHVEIMAARDLTALVGNTPLLEIPSGSGCRLLAKLEYFNPLGSVKDRAALWMVDDAEKRGVLPPGGTIIEPTSGNTGIGLAMVAAIRGYRLMLTMPETMSVERRALLQRLGAGLVLTPGAEGMKGAIARAIELNAATDASVIMGQFSNPANPAAHYATTGPEIWSATSGSVDILIAGVGTGGTITGTGRYLKEKNPAIEIIAVEPAESPVLSGGKPGPHRIQGIGAGFIPDNFDRSVVDRIVQVAGEEAVQISREQAVRSGLLVGISSGAALAAAREVASEPRNQGKTIVVILPDTGERYLSIG